MGELQARMETNEPERLADAWLAAVMCLYVCYMDCLSVGMRQ